MNYDMFSTSIIDTIKTKNLWNRVVSLDLESKVLTHDEFLSGERILGIAASRRMNGNVQTNTFLLKEETDEAESLMIKDFAIYLHQVKPLVIIGFGIRTYDYPLLMTKIRKLDDWSKSMKSEGKNYYYPEYWSLKDALVRGHILDIIDPVRFEIANHDNSKPSFVRLEKVVEHPRFSKLPLKRTKNIISAANPDEKGKLIYELWKNDKNNFVKYLEGDVHDPLLITEDLFKVRFA